MTVLDSDVALTTLALTKAMLKIADATTSEDTVIEYMINRAGALANSFTGRHLKSKAYTEYYDGNGTAELQLKNYPVSALTSVNIDSTRVFAAATAVDITNNLIQDLTAGILRLWNTGGLFYAGNAFASGMGNVKVVYTAGYKDATDNLVPADLQDASILIVQHAYRRLYNDQRIGLVSETIGDRTYNYSAEWIPKKAQEILERYMLAPSPDYAY